MSLGEGFIEVTLLKEDQDYSLLKRRSRDDWFTMYFHQSFVCFLNLTEKSIWKPFSIGCQMLSASKAALSCLLLVGSFLSCLINSSIFSVFTIICFPACTSHAFFGSYCDFPAFFNTTY